MRKRRILSLALLIGLLTASTISGKTPEENLPDLLPYETELTVLPLELSSLTVNNNVTDADDADEMEAESELYSIWNNTAVNPYQMAIDSLFQEEVKMDFANFTFPLPKHYRVTSEFGPRRYRYHYGIDLKVERGDSVVSILDGRVRVAKKMSGYGNVIVVRHLNGSETFYGHLDKILVTPDQDVKSGEMIGLGGNTGRSTGPHLHFEIRYKGHPINPRDMIDFEGLCAKEAVGILNMANFEYKKEAQTRYVGKYKKGKKGRRTLANTSTAKKTTTTGRSSGKVYVVKNGDTLGHIAQKTGSSVSQLSAKNGITKAKTLKVGQKISY